MDLYSEVPQVQVLTVHLVLQVSDLHCPRVHVYVVVAQNCENLNSTKENIQLRQVNKCKPTFKCFRSYSISSCFLNIITRSFSSTCFPPLQHYNLLFVVVEMTEDCLPHWPMFVPAELCPYLGVLDLVLHLVPNLPLLVKISEKSNILKLYWQKPCLVPENAIFTTTGNNKILISRQK